MLSAMILDVVFYCYAQCHDSGCCVFIVMLSAMMLSVFIVMLCVVFYVITYHAEFRYAECCGLQFDVLP
jgi:hypothetical protein